MTLEKEKILLKRIAEDDDKAFRELFDHWYPKVKGFLMRFVTGDDDVKDLAQTVFVKVWLTRRMLPDVKSFGAYLYTITRNAAIDWCRSHKTGIPLAELTEGQEKEDCRSDQEFFAKETGMQIAHTVSRMPRKRREIFVMSKLEGKSNGDIAAELDISKKTVESHIYLAVKELKKIITAIALFI